MLSRLARFLATFRKHAKLEWRNRPACNHPQAIMPWCAITGSPPCIAEWHKFTVRFYMSQARNTNLSTKLWMVERRKAPLISCWWTLLTHWRSSTSALESSDLWRYKNVFYLHNYLLTTRFFTSPISSTPNFMGLRVGLTNNHETYFFRDLIIGAFQRVQDTISVNEK